MVTKPALAYEPAERAFLDPTRADARDPGSARAVVVPFGLEASVSYGGGTAAGPAALIAASQQLELFDEEFWREPYRDYGVATLVAPTIAQPIEAALHQLSDLVERIVEDGRFPLVIGGEHSLTPGAMAPFAASYHDLVVLQLDAHADLRDGYLGEHNSHAAAMRRVLDHEHVELMAVGIRAISAEEIPFLEANRHRIRTHWGKDRRRWDIPAMLAPLAGRRVYVTVDIDALDSAVMPATGTPEPGGLSFDDALDILREVGRIANVVGADIVELAPLPGLHAPDFTAAKLAYKLLSYVLARPPAA